MEEGFVTACVVIDSGSNHNLLSEPVSKLMKSNKVVVSNQTRNAFKVSKGYGGQKLPMLGAFTAIINLGDRSASAEF